MPSLLLIMKNNRETRITRSDKVYRIPDSVLYMYSINLFVSMSWNFVEENDSWAAHAFFFGGVDWADKNNFRSTDVRTTTFEFSTVNKTVLQYEGDV